MCSCRVLCVPAHPSPTPLPAHRRRGPRPPQHTQCKAAMLPTSSAGLRRFMRAPGGALDGTTGVQDVQHKSAAMLQQAQVRARAHMQQHLPASMHPIHPHAVAPPPAYLRTAASLGKDLPTTTRQGWSAAASSAVAAFRASLTYVLHPTPLLVRHDTSRHRGMPPSSRRPSAPMCATLRTAALWVRLPARVGPSHVMCERVLT